METTMPYRQSHREGERRVSLRREDDKKLNVELSREQLIEIARLAIDIAKEDAQKEVGQFVINTGKGVAARFLFVLGCVAVYAIATLSGGNLHKLLTIIGL